MRNFYNLLADIVSKIKLLPSEYEWDRLTEECELSYIEEIQHFIYVHKNDFEGAAKNGLPSQVYDAIIDLVNSKNDYYFYKFVLSILDKTTFVGLEEAASEERKDGFESLNDNLEHTGIIILPKVRGPITTSPYLTKSDDSDNKPIVRKTADYWADDINSSLSNFYFVSQNDLGKYTLKNYVCDFTHGDPSIKELRIAVSPFTNQPINEVLSFDDSIIEKDSNGAEHRYFEIKSVKSKEEIIRRTQECYRSACEQKIDILMFPEMFGVEELYKTDDLQFNSIFRHLSKERTGTVPKLIIAPSFWINNKNYVNVYTDTGYKLCEQHKQHKYIFKGSNGICTEHLKNISPHICIIHIPRWGRLAIPICIDFLIDDYRRLLATKLKVDILLCPSCSSGEYDFLQYVDSYAAFGTYVVWLNTCSALAQRPVEEKNIVGAASAPVVTSESRITRFVRKCNGRCENGCLFVVTIPLNCMGISAYEGQGISVDHIRTKNNTQDLECS